MIQKLRIASLIGIQFLILIHVYIFGDRIIGSLDFQEFFHSFLKYGIINAGVILVVIAFMTTLIFGRISWHYETRSAIDRMRRISRTTGFSISLPSTTTSPVSASSKARRIFFACMISASVGVNTLFRIEICFG